jgi:RNA polymerase sigma factor for flagellar operon FliA
MGSSSYGPQSVVDDDIAFRREALVIQHLPQVRLIAKRIHDRLPSYIAVEDLVSAGVVGLIGAIDNFDPMFNVQLNTYAERRIRGAIIDSLREMDWVPRETRKKDRLIGAAIHRAKQRLGREPLEEEIAAELEIPLAEYQKWLSEVQSAELEPLEYVPGDGTRGDLLNFISDDEEDRPLRIVERSELERVLALAIDRIPKTERTVLTLYYYEELNLREIAEVMGLHLSRIHQLRVQAVLRLRSHLDRVWLSQPRSKS